MTLSTDQNPAKPELSPLSLQFLALREQIMRRWERETRARVQGADVLLSAVLTDTLPAFLGNIAEALSSTHPRDIATSNNNAAAVHGGERARLTNFGPDQLIHEYQILRESIAAETDGRVALKEEDWCIIDTSVNAAVRDAVQEFSQQQKELRRRMAATISHDMRTPLAVITSGASIIEAAENAEQSKLAARKILSSAHRLGQMIEELLDALTVHGGQSLLLAMSQFNIADLVQEVSQEYSGTIVAPIEAESEQIVGQWCRSSLRRAIENLVNNAIKYGDKGPVRVRSQRAHGRLMLTVHNTGNSIAPEQFECIFEYGTQGASTSKVEGWGIGLPFVKQVAEAHGGSIAVDSSPSTGTTFILNIPIDSRPFANAVG